MDERDEEEWPFPSYRASGRPGAPGSRGDRREQRVADHIQRHKEQGWRPPGRDRRLTREEIVRAAIAVADAEGPDAISMRRIGRELRSGTMSLYYHVGSKEDLVDAMLEAMQAEVDIPDPTGDWRADLRVFAFSERAGLLRHPWIMDFIGNRPPSGPADARQFERMLSLIDQTGLGTVAQMHVLMTLASYIMGAVVREHQEERGQRAEELAGAGIPDEERETESKRIGDWFRKSGKYPHIMRIMEAGVDPDDPKTRDERFDFGLEIVLDGIAAQTSRGPRLLERGAMPAGCPVRPRHGAGGTGRRPGTTRHRPPRSRARSTAPRDWTPARS
jgi:AcrR family transcriptional regulator